MNKSPKKPDSSKKNIELFYPFFIFLFSFLLYSQTINFKYTMFDDDSLLMANKEFFTNDGSLLKIFTTDAYMRSDMSFYRPLQNLSFLMDVKLSGGMNTWMFHFSNILVFCFIAFSLYFLLLKFKIAPLYAWLGALFYAAHPLFASSVAWLPARGDLLLTLFSIICFIFWIRFLNHKKYSALFITWLCFSLALFTKETAVFLPVLFLLYSLFFTSKPKIDFKMVLLGILMICTTVAWYFLRAVSIADSDTSITFFGFLRNFLAIPASLALFAVPYDFSTVPVITLTKIILGSAFLVLLFLLVAKKTTHSLGKKFFFLLWFLLFQLPTFFSKFIETDYLEHRFLLPLIGILIFLLIHIQEINKVKFSLFSGLIIIIFSVVSVFKAQVFANPIAFADAAIYNKKKPETHHFLKGNIAQISEKFDMALKEYNAALKYNPDHTRSLNNRGIIKQTKGDFEGALVDFNRAIELGFKDYNILRNRGIVKMNLEDFSGAIEDFSLALEFELHDDIYYHRGNAYLFLEDDENALADFNRYYTKEHIDPDFFTKLGIDFGKKGKIERSIHCFTKAIELDSTYTFAYFNRAFAKYSKADFAGALVDCEKVLAIDPLYQKALILKEQCRKK